MVNFCVSKLLIGRQKWVGGVRDSGNLGIVFIFVTFEERGYYRVVPVGQLSIDWRSYCGLIPVCQARQCPRFYSLPGYLGITTNNREKRGKNN